MPKDINDLRAARKRAAENMQAKADALVALGETEGVEAEALDAAQAEFDAAQVAFNKSDNLVKVAEAAEKAAAVSATGGDAPAAGSSVPARAANPEMKGAEVGMMIHALANAGGDRSRAIATLTDAGLDVPAAVLNASTDAAGGVTIPRAQNSGIIEALRAKAVVRRAGARVVPMPAGELRTAQESAGPSAGYGAEAANITASENTFGSIDKSFKKLTGLVPVSNSLLRQSPEAVGIFVRDSLIDSMARAEDIAFLRSDGASNDPKGLTNWALAGNKQAAVANSAAAVEAALNAAWNALEDADVSMEGAAWFMRASAKNFLASLRDANGFYIYPSIMQDGTLKGAPIFTTSQLPNNLGVGTNETEIILAGMNDMVIGDTQSITIATSTEAAYWDGAALQSAFAKDLTLMRAIAEHDFAPLHDESIAVINGVSWTV